MPSPIAHLALGYAIVGTHGHLHRRRSATVMLPGFLALLGVSMAFSLLPDIDSVVGVIAGDLGRYHNNLTHSLLLGLVIASLFAAAGRFWGLSFLSLFTIALAAYELHVLMDFFTAGRGVMLFWPLTSERFTSPVKLFYGFHWSDGLVSVRHLWTLLTELFFTGIVVLIVNVLWQKKSVTHHPSSSADI